MRSLGLLVLLSAGCVGTPAYSSFAIYSPTRHQLAVQVLELDGDKVRSCSGGSDDARHGSSAGGCVDLDVRRVHWARYAELSVSEHPHPLQGTTFDFWKNRSAACFGEGDAVRCGDHRLSFTDAGVVHERVFDEACETIVRMPSGAIACVTADELVLETADATHVRRVPAHAVAFSEDLSSVTAVAHEGDGWYRISQLDPAGRIIAARRLARRVIGRIAAVSPDGGRAIVGELGRYRLVELATGEAVPLSGGGWFVNDHVILSRSGELVDIADISAPQQLGSIGSIGQVQLAGVDRLVTWSDEKAVSVIRRSDAAVSTTPIGHLESPLLFGTDTIVALDTFFHDPAAGGRSRPAMQVIDVAAMQSRELAPPPNSHALLAIAPHGELAFVDTSALRATDDKPRRSVPTLVVVDTRHGGQTTMRLPLKPYAPKRMSE